MNGKVLYSEGIDVGYRYYDAHHETPLFPFGYGLSYTSFRFSGLRITRQAGPAGGGFRDRSLTPAGWPGPTSPSCT